MANTKFTKNAISVLKKNPYVEKVTPGKITFTQEFIELVLEDVKLGEPPIDIFKKYGFSERVLGKTRILGAVGLWKSRYEVVSGPRKPKVSNKPVKETAEQRRKRMLGAAILHCDSLMETPDKIADFDKGTTDVERRYLAIRQTYLDRVKTNKFVVKDLVEYYGLSYDHYFGFLHKMEKAKQPVQENLLKRRRKAK